VGLIDPGYHIFDGADELKNCSDQNLIIWTYNAGIALYGAAVLYNYTNGSVLWAERTEGFLSATANFFTPYDNASNIMYEPACETVNTCNNDQFSFKGYLSRFMWDTTVLAPFTRNAVTALLTPSARAAAIACSGGAQNTTCGQKWYVGGYDGKFGVGQQMSALETIQGLLIGGSVPPLHSNQVHLMNAVTTSSAPVLTQTKTPARAPAESVGSSMTVSGFTWSLCLAVLVVFMNVGLSPSML
jgi:mannan endo-1,6-alpha-mannosidase